ncbi:MAG: sulfite exporter TauE/SafE family protein [Deltaproteobacteria bacterium]|nr:sulfite exporter TauE/SafE family protein [Deltaproteobacteria bacterium]
MDWIHAPIVVFIGILAGFLNILAGGGSLLILPLLIFLGVPGATANGTNRIGILVQNLSSMAAFFKKGERFHADVIFIIMAACLGSYFGSQIAIYMNDKTFRQILAALILFIGFFTFIRYRRFKKLQDEEEVLEMEHSLHEPMAFPSGVRKMLLVVAFFFIGIYGGFIQAGTGFLIIATLGFFTNWDLMRINAVKILVILFFNVVAFVSFFMAGKIHYFYGFLLAIGQAAGAWIGTHWGYKKNEGVILMVMLVALSGFAIKLLFF